MPGPALYKSQLYTNQPGALWKVPLLHVLHVEHDPGSHLPPQCPDLCKLCTRKLSCSIETQRRWQIVVLDCREAHVEAAVVYGVRSTSLLVFVPKFHMKGSVHLTDRAGLVRLPLTAPGQNTDDAFAVSERRQFRLETGITRVWTLCLG